MRRTFYTAALLWILLGYFLVVLLDDMQDVTLHEVQVLAAVFQLGQRFVFRLLTTATFTQLRVEDPTVYHLLLQVQLIRAVPNFLSELDLELYL